MALQLLELFIGFQGLIESIQVYVRGLIEGIGNTLGGILESVRGIVGQLANTIITVIGTVISGLQNTLAGLIGGITLLLGQIAENIASVPQRLGEFAQRVADALGELPGDLATAIAGGAGDVLTTAFAWLIEHWEEIKAIIGGFFPALPLAGFIRFADRALREGLTPADLDLTNSPPELETPIDHFFFAVLAGVGAVFSIKGAAEVVLGRTMIGDLNQHFQNELPSIAVAVELERRGLASEATVEHIRERQGYNEFAFDALRQAATSPLAPGQVLELYNRNGRDADFLASKLADTGAHARDTELYKQLADQLPGPQDLVSFTVKEVFTPAVAEAFGQFEEAERLPYDRFAQLGISEEHAKEYWAAHWGLPSPEQGFAMFQRGIIDFETLKLLLRALDVMPYWREKLINLNYHTLTRVDIRRVHKALNKDHQWLVDQHKAIGLSPDNAETLAQFVEKLNGEDDATQIKQIRAPIEGRAVRAFRKGYMDEVGLRELLALLSYTKAQADQLIALARLDEEADAADAIETAARQGYVSGVRTAADTRAILAAYGFRPEAIGRLLGVWDTLRTNRELTEAERHERDLTRAEVMSAYEARILSGPDTLAALLAMGYDRKEAATIIALSDVKVVKANTNDLLAAIRADYVAGKIARGEAGAQLDRGGIATARREQLLRKWELERDQREGHIGVSDLKDMFQKDIITETDAREQLRIQGFGVKQIAWYLQSWGNRAALAP